ncbi:hypothetical protein AHAS_Ahas09G0056200 [Arachis hypogaea]
MWGDLNPNFLPLTSPATTFIVHAYAIQSILDNPSEPAKVDYFSGQCYHRMVGSCHGLLCFFDDDGGQNTHGILWNSCTGFTFQSPQISGQPPFVALVTIISVTASQLQAFWTYKEESATAIWFGI